MGFRINSSLPSAGVPLSRPTNSRLNQSFERLSSGLRISRPKDTAGLKTVAPEVRAEIAFLEQAIRNSPPKSSAAFQPQGTTDPNGGGGGRIVEALRELNRARTSNVDRFTPSTPTPAIQFQEARAQAANAPATAPAANASVAQETAAVVAASIREQGGTAVLAQANGTGPDMVERLVNQGPTTRPAAVAAAPQNTAFSQAAPPAVQNTAVAQEAATTAPAAQFEAEVAQELARMTEAEVTRASATALLAQAPSPAPAPVPPQNEGLPTELTQMQIEQIQQSMSMAGQGTAAPPKAQPPAARPVEAMGNDALNGGAGTSPVDFGAGINTTDFDTISVEFGGVSVSALGVGVPDEMRMPAQEAIDQASSALEDVESIRAQTRTRPGHQSTSTLVSEPVGTSTTGQILEPSVTAAEEALGWARDSG